MAEGNFDKYHYIRTYGQTLELIDYLTKFLHNHPNTTSIPVLGEDKTQESLTRQDAIAIIGEYLIAHNAPESLIERFRAEPDPSPRLLIAVNEFLSRKQDENSLTLAAREEAIKQYQDFIETRRSAMQPGSTLEKAIDDFKNSVDAYNRSLFELKAGVLGENTEISQKQEILRATIFDDQEIITPSEIPDTLEKIAKIAPIIVSSSQIGELPEEEAAHLALESLAKSDPLLSKLAILTAEPSSSVALLELSRNAVNHTTQKTGKTISQIQSEYLSITSSTTQNFVLQRQQATSAMVQKLLASPSMSDEGLANQIAEKIFTESLVSAYKTGVPESTNTLIARALSSISLNIPDSEVASARETISNILQDFTPEIEAHNKLQILEASKKGFGYKLRSSTLGTSLKLPNSLLPQEVQIAIKTGLDPATITSVISGSKSPESQQILRQIRTTLSPIDNFRFNGMLNVRRFRYAINRLRAFEDAAWNTWFLFEDNLPHNRLVDTFYNWRYNFTERISSSNLGWILTPLKRLDKVKKDSTLGLIKSLKNSKTLFGRFFHRSASLYAKGNFTVGGFAKQASIYTISGAAKWAKKKITRTTAFKALRIAFKGVIKKATGWIAKKAAAWGLESTLAAATGGLGTVLLVADLAWEGLKFLWKNRKKITQFVKDVINGIKGVATYLYTAIKSWLVGIITTIQTTVFGLGAVIGGFLVGGIPGALVGIGAWVIAANWGTVSAALQSAIASVTSFAGTFAAGFQAAISGLISSTTTFLATTLGVSALASYFVIAAITTSDIATFERPDAGIAPPGGVACTFDKNPIDISIAVGEIAERGAEIVSDLYQGFWCFWNRSPGDYATDTTDYPPSYPELFDKARFESDPNESYTSLSSCSDCLFWCTWLTLKAYTETGNDIPIALNSQAQADGFRTEGRYIEPEDATSSNIPPGATVYFHYNGGPNRLNHTALVVNVSSDGIAYVQSNAGSKTGSITFKSPGPGVQDIPGATVGGFGLP